MKAVCYSKPGLKILDMPEPEPGPEDVKIKIAFASICGSDPHIFTGDFDAFIEAPMILGHEASGTVVELGDQATAKGLQVGDRVTYYFNQYCGKCFYCRNGQEGYCLKIEVHASAMAEYLVCNEQQVYKLPDSISLEEGCLAEPVSVCLRGIDLANIRPGSKVAIFGGGGIGLILLQLAIRSGAVTVAVVEPVEEKRKLAEELGADHVINPKKQDIMAESMKITQDRGFDTVIEASGVQAAVKPAFEVLGKGGTLEYFGLYPMDYNFPLNLFTLFNKEATIRGVYQSPYELPRAIALMPKLNLKPLTTTVIPLDDVRKAFEIQKTAKFPKVILSLG